MATATWTKLEDAVIAKLKELPPDYELVVTGHSLGAGVACLITVLIYHQRHILRRKVRCLAFAPPPVFYPQQAAPDAVSNTIAYIHGTDVVPFLSVFNVRRFFNMVTALDQVTSKMWLYEKILIDWDFRQPTPQMIDALLQAENNVIRDINGSERVGIPAKAVVWLREPKEGEVKKDASTPKENIPLYTACMCDSLKIADLNILLHMYMISDHFPSKYELALLRGQVETRSNGIMA